MTWNPFAVWFRHPTPDEVINQQLYEARINYLHHMAEAEHHLALSEMYQTRCLRLEAISRGATK